MYQKATQAAHVRLRTCLLGALVGSMFSATDLYRQAIKDGRKRRGAFAFEAAYTLRLCLLAGSC